MADLPFPLESSQLEELKPQILQMFRDIYEERLGGATLGDVFKLDGDVFQLQIKAGSGLTKSDGKLDFDKSVIGTTALDITNTPAGSISSVTVQGAINELDTEKVSQNAVSVAFRYLCLQPCARPSAVAGHVIIYCDSSDSHLYIVWTDGTRTLIA